MNRNHVEVCRDECGGCAYLTTEDKEKSATAAEREACTGPNRRRRSCARFLPHTTSLHHTPHRFVPLTRHYRATSLGRALHLPTPGLDEIVDLVDFATTLFRESRRVGQVVAGCGDRT